MQTFKIKKENLGDQISDLLKERIINGEWKIDEKIPSENELANSYGVSRLTVRLALQKLIGQGMLETRVGEGTFVREFDFNWYLNEISDILIKPEMLDDVQEFRTILEIRSAKLAMESATETEIEELIHAANSYEKFMFDTSKSIDYNLDKQANLDYNFHYKLCEISHNSLIKLSYSIAKKPIIEYLRTIIKSRLENYFEESELTFENGVQFPSNIHYQMAQSIKDKDFEKFKELYFKMVNYKDTKGYYKSISS